LIWCVLVGRAAYFGGDFSLLLGEPRRIVAMLAQECCPKSRRLKMLPMREQLAAISE
jgi:hypothetical protein